MFYKNKSIRDFDEKNNSCHEGTNNGLEKCAGKVTPSMHFDESCARLCNQAERNSALHTQKIGSEVHGQKQWST